MTWKAEVSDSAVQAKHDGTTRAHPDNRKMKVKKNFFRASRGDRHYTPLYTAFGIGHTTLKYLTPALLAT